MEAPSPMLRYFCVTDETSELGALSLAFADAFVAMGLPIRILAIEVLRLQLENSRWHAHSGRFLTPMTAPYVNVVCGGADAWKRLYTVGVKNVLITSDPPERAIHNNGIRAAMQYEMMIVPTQDLADQWAMAGAVPLVIPLSDLQTAQLLRLAVVA